MKFDNVPTETDTKITLNIETMFGEYPVLYQKWIWDGIEASSLIFDNDDVSDIDLNTLIDEVKNSALVDDSSKEITSKISGEYTFINFNFNAC
jgi:hypothetical protein